MVSISLHKFSICSCMLFIGPLELLNINHSYFLSDSNNIQIVSEFDSEDKFGS